ncbi:hypothetical protein CBL_08477 [Carabus blaptoides fortunei]
MASTSKKCCVQNCSSTDLKCVIDGVTRIAKWQHISELYALDRNEEISDLRMLQKLAEHQIRPNHTEDEAGVDGEAESIESYESTELPNVNEEGIALNNSNYCAGYVLKHVKKYIGKCVDCKSDLEAVKAGIQHCIIKARECDSTARLVYPSISSVTTFIDMKK